MGFWSDTLSRTMPVAWFTPRVTYISAAEVQSMLTDVGGWTPAQMYRRQPHLRTVTSFLGRNNAQLGWHFYRRTSETDRTRDRDNAAAALLSKFVGEMTSYQRRYALTVDRCLYDQAFWWVVRGQGVYRLPPAWLERIPGNFPEPTTYRVTYPGGKTVKIPADDLLVFGGYDPIDPSRGSPAIEALKETLQEQIEASVYRKQVWARGGRVSAVIERPATSRQWSPEQREAFRQDWYAKYTGRGAKAGGTPILEDGMKLNRVDFSATDQQWVEGIKLGLAQTASAYHVNPTMVGLLDNANFSNVREFRRMLYGETLGPEIAAIEATVNERLLPMLGVPDDVYMEINIAEKLQGSFEEQGAILQTATGGPWMSRAEARARMNLPYLEGTDDLIVPLNVLIGGQASPTDSAPKSGLVEFRARQMQVIRTKIGAGQPWWDADRWDRELVALGWEPDAARAANTEMREAIERELKAQQPTAAVTAAFQVADGGSE